MANRLINGSGEIVTFQSSRDGRVMILEKSLAYYQRVYDRALKLGETNYQEVYERLGVGTGAGKIKRKVDRGERTAINRAIKLITYRMKAGIDSRENKNKGRKPSGITSFHMMCRKGVIVTHGGKFNIKGFESGFCTAKKVASIRCGDGKNDGEVRSEWTISQKCDVCESDVEELIRWQLKMTFKYEGNSEKLKWINREARKRRRVMSRRTVTLIG